MASLFRVAQGASEGQAEVKRVIRRPFFVFKATGGLDHFHLMPYQAGAAPAAVDNMLKTWTGGSELA
ncbi:hypothetical protein MHUMG1_01063 [Metarhizium humberi]|uniref:Uncharacterized protein n=1 Tax=Metarhizium humberi TaxID=2596975 RepID=A0A9P8MGX3_9HYPO|nr:hypothetical protein MHUMG1_01063 [Metarhizium humberi]